MNSNLIVTYKDRAVEISIDLLEAMGKWNELERISALHKQRLIIEDLMDGPSSASSMALLLSRWTQLQYDLQGVWGFDRNSNYHKFWEIPACVCPYLDNEERYPYGLYYHSGGCKVHVL